MLQQSNQAYQNIVERFSISQNDCCIIHNDRKYSYSDIWILARALRNQWQAENYKIGTKIIFQMPNHPLLLVAYLAAMMGGHVIVPLPDILASDSVTHCLKTAQPYKKLKKIHINDFNKKSLTAPPSLDDFFGDDTAPFGIFFTSGSTGKPKGICHSFSSLWQSASAFGALSGFDKNTRLLHILPMIYMAGINNCFLAPLSQGACLNIGDAYSPLSGLTFWQQVNEQRITHLSLTPTIINSLFHLSKKNKDASDFAEYIMQIQSTSAPIQTIVKSNFENLFHKNIQNCYGITELGGALTLQNLSQSRMGNSAGTPINGIDIKIDMDKNLLIKSPYRMLGYWQDGGAKMPNDLFNDDGYMDTGDLASDGPDGLDIIGRKKDIIIRGGVNISPLAIENYINQFPHVAEAAVMGAENEFWGEIIVAFIVADSNILADNAMNLNFQDNITNLCNKHLPANERTDKIIFIDKIPRLFNGKKDSIALYKLYLQYIKDSDKNAK